PGMAAGPGRRDGALARGPNKDGALDGLKNLVAANNRKPAKETGRDKKLKAPSEKQSPTAVAKLDPKKIWQDALLKGVDDPGLIIATADFLGQQKLFNHLAEFLKANLRQGIVVRPWVYDALALALEASGGSLEDIERARVSTVDLQPQDAQGYVRASKSMG